MKKHLMAATMLALSFSFLFAAGCAGGSGNSDDSQGTSSEETLPQPPGDGEGGGSEENGGNDGGEALPETPGGGTGDNSGGSNGGENVSPEPEPEDPQEKQAQYITVTGQSVNIRSGPGTGYPSVGLAEKGTAYAVGGKEGNWYQTWYKNQKVYIHGDYAVTFSLPKSDNEKIEEVISEGYKQIGVPYVYGAVRLHDGYGNRLKGFTKAKFDCSSLVQYVFHEGADVLLQTTTRTQVKQGKFVPRSELSRGDCIYFTNATRLNNTGVERIGHVAIYLGGNYILHTATDYARIEQISSTRWSYYIETRRFV